MSLLLEALKKAEKAKEEAQRRARGEDTGGEPRLDAEAAPPRPKAVMTRPELPDIRQPLEILSDDIAPKAAPQPTAAVEKPPAAPQPQKPVTPKPETQAAERATAKKVFEAKFREPNPRMPFYITMAVLGIFFLGTVGYFWYQLRSPPALVNANPPKTGSEAPPQVAGAKPAEAPVAAATPAAIPGLPATTAPATSAPAAAETKAAAPKPAAVEPKPAPRPVQPVAAPAAAPAAPTFSASRTPPQVRPKVESAYAAYLGGDLATARADYQQALREEAGNRDALLGLAAVDVRTGRLEAAEAAYLRLLQINPNDAHAQAGLIALRSARLDPLTTESRVKNMLAADPGANVLHFTLGNQLALQERWAEAQQEYFKAFAAEPDSADIAYNLAVSLDHLRQPTLALEYYRRAIALAEGRGASFDAAAARNRAAQLAR
ncbi:MAG: tetratricopeptide repeat protein [Betaproteobacteria bacterium]|nr:MAG: tetratricopeptide repeat protein [Betaproteobacteria bacterium]